VTKLVEFVWQDGPRTRIEFPEASPYKGQIIVEDDHQRLHYYPDRNEIDVEPPRRMRPPRMVPAGEQKPKFTHVITTGGLVAGKQTQLVTVADQSGNVMQRMWIEPHTGVMLKRVLLDRGGSQRGYFEFTKINFRPKFSPGDFKIERKGATLITPVMQVQRLALQKGLSLIVLPPSSEYQLEGARAMDREGQDVLVQTYRGKSGRFQIFQVKGPINPERLRRFARGRLSTYSWMHGSESLALVGELPETRLRELARVLGDK
jgi:negative regulator of sigma E activity